MDDYNMSEENRRIQSNEQVVQPEPAGLASLKYAKTVSVDGIDYVLQKLPVRPGLELRQRAREGGDVDDIKFYEELLQHVVIRPKKRLDEFDDIGHLEKLMKAVIEYQYQGK